MPDFSASALALMQRVKRFAGRAQGVTRSEPTDGGVVGEVGVDLLVQRRDRRERALDRLVLRLVARHLAVRLDRRRLVDHRQPALSFGVVRDQRFEVVLGDALDRVVRARLDPRPDDQRHGGGGRKQKQKAEQNASPSPGRAHLGFIGRTEDRRDLVLGRGPRRGLSAWRQRRLGLVGRDLVASAAFGARRRRRPVDRSRP